MKLKQHSLLNKCKISYLYFDKVLCNISLIEHLFLLISFFKLHDLIHSHFVYPIQTFSFLSVQAMSRILLCFF